MAVMGQKAAWSVGITHTNPGVSAWLLGLLYLLLLASWGLFTLLAALFSAALLRCSCLTWGKLAKIYVLQSTSPHCWPARSFCQQLPVEPLRLCHLTHHHLQAAPLPCPAQFWWVFGRQRETSTHTPHHQPDIIL